MKTVKNVILGLIGAFGAIESFLALAGSQSQSAMHQIYGGTMLIVLTLAVGLWEDK